MFSFTKPTKGRIAEFIAANKEAGFSYPYIGASVDNSRLPDELTAAYNVDHNQVLVGKGVQVFEKAKQAIREWKMFDMQWVQLCWTNTPMEVGRTVAILIRHFGFYSLNAARIVYTIDRSDSFGFAYGTLADHGESGEERFSVRFDRDTGDVIYDLYAFSRPNQLLASLGYPLTRILQKTFAEDSKHAMRRWISDI